MQCSDCIVCDYGTGGRTEKNAFGGQNMGAWHEQEYYEDADVDHWDGTVQRGDTGHVMAEDSQHGRRGSSQGRRSDALSVERDQSPSRGGAHSPSASLRTPLTL